MPGPLRTLILSLAVKVGAPAAAVTTSTWGGTGVGPPAVVVTAWVGVIASVDATVSVGATASVGADVGAGAEVSVGAAASVGGLVTAAAGGEVGAAVGVAAVHALNSSARLSITPKTMDIPRLAEVCFVRVIMFLLLLVRQTGEQQ